MADNIDRRRAKCLVCHRVIEELFNEIGHESQSVGLNRVTGDNVMHDTKDKKSFKTQKSEMYFDDLMDRLCKKMGEYVRVINKSSGQLDVIPLLIDGKMNIDLSSYDIIKDGDIESVEYYCESIISEYEENMLQLFKEGVTSEKYKQDICLNSEVCKPLRSVPKSKDEF